tara:strand:- start:68864 stop:70123 length:1260 start_codon:yes stop_codon:yes gene_type:complete
MNLLVNYIKGFINRSGNYVALSTLISRFLSFLGAWIALQIIDSKELGVILFAFSIIQFIIPLGGFGLHQSLVRYGALLKTTDEKNQLFSFVIKKGVIASVTLIFLIIVAGYFIPFQFDQTYYYLIILSTAITTNFVFEVIKIQFRLNHQNKNFAKSEIVFSIIQVVLIFTLSYLFQGLGYVISLITAPLIASLLFMKSFTFHKKVSLKIMNSSFWKYGFFASLSNVVTQLLFIVDILLIGYFLNNSELVTTYRYVSIIPFSLLFLPRIFMTTDFVSFTENIYDKKYINNYIKSYMSLFSILSIIILIVSFLFSLEILKVFQKGYEDYSTSFLILMIGVIGIYMTRGLFGNLLSSIGKAKLNYYIAISALALNIIGNSYTIPEYGLKGAAIITSTLMWLTGVASGILFKIHYRKLLLKKL